MSKPTGKKKKRSTPGYNMIHCPHYSVEGSYIYRVWVVGEKEPRLISALMPDHVEWQVAPKKVRRYEVLTEEEYTQLGEDKNQQDPQ